MSVWDELAAAAARYKPGPGTPPPPLPEPGAPSGIPAGSEHVPAVTPLAGDGTPQLDSGIHLFQPRDIGNLKWSDRFRRIIGLQAGTGLQDYPALLMPALVLNQFDPENYYPNDRLLACAATQGQVGASVSRIQLFNPAGSTILAIIEEIQAWRVNTAGELALYSDNGAIAATETPIARDTRQDGTPLIGLGGAACTVGVATSVGGSPGTRGLRGTSGIVISPWVVRGPIVLRPGRGVSIEPIVSGSLTKLVNEGVSAGFVWRETAFAT